MRRMHPAWAAPLLIAGLGSCADLPTAAAPGEGPDPERPHALGLIEIAFTVGTPGMSAVLAWQTNRIAIPGGIELGLRTTSTLDVDGERYLQAVFEVRNATADGTAGARSLRNITFLPVATSGTIPGTPVQRLLKQDGSAADPSLAQQFRPTGAVADDGGSGVASQYPDVLQVFTEADLSAMDFTGTTGVLQRFPYGFVTRRAGDDTMRELPANPTAGEFDGTVTFAFRFPKQADPADNPFTVAIMAVAIEDSVTRVTQSLEEQGAGQTAFEARAASLGAADVVILGGGTYSGPAAMRRVCDVRIAGTPAAPLALLSSPDPCTSSGIAYTWTGAVSAEWMDPGNWLPELIPSALDSVLIEDVAVHPAISDGDHTKAAVVMPGPGSATLDLGGHVLTITGDLSAPGGSLTNGTVRLTGSPALIEGNAPVLRIDGDASLQGVTTVTGALSINGSLATNGHSLRISIP